MCSRSRRCATPRSPIAAPAPSTTSGLEFLGDSILNCAVARLLYDAHPAGGRRRSVAAAGLPGERRDAGADRRRAGFGRAPASGRGRIEIRRFPPRLDPGGCLGGDAGRHISGCRVRCGGGGGGASSAAADGFAGGRRAEGSEDPAAGAPAGAGFGVARLYADGGCRAIRMRSHSPSPAKCRRSASARWARAAAGAAPSNWPRREVLDLLPAEMRKPS